MKVSILFLYFSVVRATDDASLMQQGVGIESGVLIGSVSEQFQTRLNNVQDALKEVPHQGKMRQMAIDSLMQAVAKKSNDTAAGSPTVAEQLTQVKALLWDLLNGFQAEIENEVTALQNANTLITNCNNAGVTDDETKENTSNDEKADHETCRTGTDGEFTKRQAVETACRDLINRVEEFRSTADPGAHATCVTHLSAIPCTGGCADYVAGKYATDVPHVFERNGGAVKQIDSVDIQHVSVESAGWTTHQSTMKSFWEGQHTYWDTRASGCKTAVTNWKTKRDACDTEQNTFEQAFCTWVTHRNSRCSTLVTCHADRLADFTTLNGTQTGHDTNRVAVAEIVQRVICLVGVLENNNADLGAYPASNDACDTKVTNNNSEIVAAMTRAKPTPDPIDDCFDVNRPWPSDGDTGGNQPAGTASEGTAFNGWYSTEFGTIQSTFSAESFPDNDLDLTDTARAECITGVA